MAAFLLLRDRGARLGAPGAYLRPSLLVQCLSILQQRLHPTRTVAGIQGRAAARIRDVMSKERIDLQVRERLTSMLVVVGQVAAAHPIRKAFVRPSYNGCRVGCVDKILTGLYCPRYPFAKTTTICRYTYCTTHLY